MRNRLIKSVLNLKIVWNGNAGHHYGHEVKLEGKFCGYFWVVLERYLNTVDIHIDGLGWGVRVNSTFDMTETYPNQSQPG